MVRLIIYIFDKCKAVTQSGNKINHKLIIVSLGIYKEIKKILANKSKIVITTHLNPDGDALGSSLGLYWFLKELGHDVIVILPNEYPDFLQWLPGNETVIDYVKRRKQVQSWIEEAEIIFFLDHNDVKRAGDMKEILTSLKAKKIMIDHHPYPQMDVDFAFSSTEASSTAEMVYEFIISVDGRDFISKTVAECIYTGIMTDTGCFSYNSSRARTFEIVSHLLSLNIPKDEIFRHIYDNFSAQRMRLLGYCLNEKMQVLPEYRTAYMSISLEEQERFNFAPGDSEGFVNYPLSIKGISFTAFFVERKDKVKISFRSKGNFQANGFSEKNFSGGGHVNAAGGESFLSLKDTIQKFLDLLPKYSGELNA
jgi:bifunctional oligoribonuclease and PAP phosphatase NrnA